MKTTHANPHRPFKGSRVAVLVCWLAGVCAGTATPDAAAWGAEVDENPLWQGKMFFSNLFLPGDTPKDQRLPNLLELTGKVMRIREGLSWQRRNRP